MPCRQDADRDVLLFSWALAQDQTTDIGKDCFEGVDLGRPIAEVILAVHFVIVVREVGWGSVSQSPIMTSIELMDAPPSPFVN
jgi:hypothetical protein